MPQLIALAVAGAGLYAGYRWIAGKVVQAQQRAAEAEAELRARAGSQTVEPRDLGTLTFDEAAGVYRPRKPG